MRKDTNKQLQCNGKSPVIEICADCFGRSEEEHLNHVGGSEALNQEKIPVKWGNKKEEFVISFLSLSFVFLYEHLLLCWVIFFFKKFSWWYFSSLNFNDSLLLGLFYSIQTVYTLCFELFYNYDMFFILTSFYIWKRFSCSYSTLAFVKYFFHRNSLIVWSVVMVQTKDSSKFKTFR